VLALIWWAWSGYAWMTNAIDIDSTAVRLFFLGGTAASFFMALAVPRAYDEQGAWFVVPYFRSPPPPGLALRLGSAQRPGAPACNQAARALVSSLVHFPAVLGIIFYAVAARARRC
jgi:Bacterial low temperature requirement A protein (LtrA)